MSKEEYSIARVSKSMCEQILMDHHYLSGVSKDFKSGVNVGLLHDGKVIGACIFTGWPVPELLTGCFGLPRSEQGGFWELSRLVLDPKHQSSEHNLASWFVSRSIRLLRSESHVRAILSYADDDHHKGTVYAATNFKYYGLSAPKKDFWFRSDDGSLVKHSRGKTNGRRGEWRDRSRKHRFLMVFDNNLECKWSECKWDAIKEKRQTTLAELTGAKP